MGESCDLLPSDLSDSLPKIVETLNAGRLVRLSDGQRSALLANGTCDPVESDLARPRNGSAGVLLLRDPSSAMDLVAEPSPVARRLMRNCWPGSVRLVFSRGMDEQLIGRLPGAVRQTVEDDRGFSLGVPDSALLQHLLKRVAFPLVKVNIEAVELHRPSGLTVFRSDAQSVGTEAEIRIDGHHWELVTAAGLSPEEVSRMTTERILFVCTGNTCRSPMAEGMFRRMLAERLECPESELAERGYEITSAGLSAPEGCPVSPESVEVCRDCGVDLTGHSSQPLTESLLLESDRIYTMTVGHRDAILSRYPQLEGNVRLLSPVGKDVSDPIGWGSAAYRKCHQEITESLKALVEELAANQ